MKRKAKKKPSTGLTKKERSTIAKKARSGKKFGKKTTFEDVYKKALKQYGDPKIAKKVAGSAFWKGRAAAK